MDGRTIDYGALARQPGDAPPEPFSWMTSRLTNPQLDCAITATTPATHDLIRAHLDQAPMYAGRITGTGVRYCPSIEDKVVRFAERPRHQIFLEPEGLDDRTVYPNGISMSLPRPLQAALLATIPGLERAAMLQPGYAIEYDYVDPRELGPSLETRHLRPAEHDAERPHRHVAHRGQLAHLALEQQPGVAGQQMGDALGRRVGAMRCAEGVVDVHVGQPGERRGQLGIVARLPRLEAAVLEHQQLARAQALGLRLDLGADDRRRHADLGAQQIGHAGRHWRHRERRVRTVLRPAEVRDQHGGGAAVADQLDRRQSRADAGVVGHRRPAVTVRQRHVEVDSGEHPLAADRGVANARLVEGAALAQTAAGSRSRTLAASSTQRFEYPHSLSYQANTLAKFPSITAVCSESKIDECGSLTMSVETIGSSV